MKIRKRYKLALAVISFMMFGPGVLTILALIKYLDRFDVPIGGLSPDDPNLSL